jgi:hypothetical protein
LYRKYFEASQISMEPYLSALEENIQQAVALRQQQMQGQMPPGGPPQGPPGPPQIGQPQEPPQEQAPLEQGGEPGAGPEEGPFEQTADNLGDRYMRTAGGPPTGSFSAGGFGRIGARDPLGPLCELGGLTIGSFLVSMQTPVSVCVGPELDRGCNGPEA